MKSEAYYRAKKKYEKSEKGKAAFKRYYSKNKDKLNEIRRAKCKGKPRLRDRTKIRARQRELYVQRAYGVSNVYLLGLRASQKDCCAICELPFSSDRKARIDHCHESGKVRGWLCHHCNVGLGHFSDNPERLLKAAEYINLARIAVSALAR